MNPIFKVIDFYHGMALKGIREFGLSPASVRGLSDPSVDPDEAAFAADFD